MSVRGNVHLLKKPGGRNNAHSVFEGFFFCSNMHFKAKLREVVREEGDPFFNFGPGFKDKYIAIYINHAEYIK